MGASVPGPDAAAQRTRPTHGDGMSGRRGRGGAKRRRTDKQAQQAHRPDGRGIAQIWCGYLVVLGQF